MAVKKCCIEKCKSCSTRKEDKGVTFHKFPKDVTSRNEWQSVTQFTHIQHDLSAYVCSRHFCKADFQKNKDSKYVLKSDAVPSIFPWTIDSIKMDASNSDETLSSINEDLRNSSTQSSEVENLDAIKKFIEEQEKELQEKKIEENELLVKNVQEKEPEEMEVDKGIFLENELHVNAVQAKEKLEENILHKNEIHEIEQQDKTMRTVTQSIENVNASERENLSVASSVMEMILNDSVAKIAEKDIDDNARDGFTPTLEETERSDHKFSRSNEKGGNTMSLSVGSKVEAKDFSDDWYAAEIAEVDYDEMEVLVRYDIDLKKPDEWINVSSPRLRPYTGNTTKPTPVVKDEIDPPIGEQPVEKENVLLKEKVLPPKEMKEEPKEDIVKIEDKPKQVFEEGERCLARWRDNRRFVATIHKDLGDGKFEIIFDDGFHWTCSVARLHKMKADSLTVDTSFQSASAGSPSPLDSAGPCAAPISPSLPPYHTHLFDPSRDYLGSKSERRERKRKLNIKEIFNIGQKKCKTQKTDTRKTTKPPAEKKPKVVKKNVAPRAPVEKKEIKTEIPDAVASIIGTITKEVEIKLEPIPLVHENKEATQTEEIKDEYVNQDSEADSMKEDEDSMVIEQMEPIGCVVNPNDATLDDEDAEEPKSEGDPVLDEETKLENFEEQDAEKHEEVIDKIKEAIIKLEGGINAIENVNSPKLDRVNTPVKEIETFKNRSTPEPKQEPKSELLKDVLAEVASSIEIGDTNTEDKDSALEIKSNVPKSKKEISKMKKGKKLRMLNHKRSVNRQVEKVKNELEEMKRQFEAMRKRILMQEYGQNIERSALPESYLAEGEWCCRWVNGQPVGRVSEIEGAPQQGLDNKPALPRRSVEVEDKRLPPGWTKHMVRRSVGHSAGKWDVVLVSPEQYGNKKFHVKSEMRNFLENCQDGSLKPYERALLDFGVHLKVARRMNWVVNTPDGITEAPERILPANTSCNVSPLVTRKSHNTKKIMKEKKRGLLIKDKKKRRPIKLKLQKGLHTYNSQLIIGEPSGEIQAEPAELAYEPPLTPLEDGYVYVGSLKVQIIDMLLRCPAEGCFKNFRTKTLLQMHIKHYHRELRTKMGATPKVLDLAYARTKPNMAELPQTDKKVIKVKFNKPPKREELKIPVSDSEMTIDNVSTTPVKIEDFAPTLPKIPRSLDSPKLRQALIHKPVKRPRVLLPVRRLLEPEEAVPDSMNDDNGFEKQTTEPLIEVPSLRRPLDFETAISTHTVTKPLEKRKKGDKKKTFATFSKNISEDEEWFAMNDDDLDTRSSFPRSGSPDSKDMKMGPMFSESNDDLKDSHLYTYTETGERIKIVQMKREEIINCHCGMREEDGLMVQCELCLCWQHAHCYNIQRECDVPVKYTCSICVNPRRGRRSRRFLHDQDRLYEGLLPGAGPCDSLRRAHEVSGNLVRIDDALHALRVKFHVATKKDHPKLYLWAKDWEEAEITLTQEKLNSDYSDLNIMINGMDKENHPVKQEDDEMEIKTPPSEDQESDRSSQRDNQIGSQALLSGLLSSPGGASLDLPISTSELERLAKSVQESAEWERLSAPQPEAAIENSTCREHLLKHIQRCQTLIDTRLDSIEAHVVELESEDPSFGEHYETAEFYPRTKQTIQMLMRDLDIMEELGVIT